MAIKWKSGDKALRLIRSRLYAEQCYLFKVTVIGIDENKQIVVQHDNGKVYTVKPTDLMA